MNPLLIEAITSGTIIADLSSGECHCGLFYVDHTACPTCQYEVVCMNNDLFPLPSEYVIYFETHYPELAI